MRKSFMGSCEIAGCTIAASSMNCGLEIKPAFYDHFFGKRDTTSSPKGPGGALAQQKTLYRWAPGLAKMTASGLPLSGLGGIWNEAFNANPTDGSIVFSEGGVAKGISQGIISSLTIDARAGENVSISVELIGIELAAGGGSQAVTDCIPPITWNDFSVDSGFGTAVGFTVTISNPVKPVYTSNRGYYADVLRVGIQEITGSITTIDGEDWKKEGAISFNAACAGGGGGSFLCLFEGSKYSGDSGGIACSTTNFYGYQN